MNLVLWMLLGFSVAWVKCVLLNGNAARTLLPSVAIGVTGAIVGGLMIAPHIGAPMVDSSDFSPFGLLVAGACATAAVTVGDILYRRHGV